MTDAASETPAHGPLPVATLARLQAFDGSIWLVLLLADLGFLTLAVLEGELGAEISLEVVLWALLPPIALGSFAAGHLLCAHGLRKGQTIGVRLLRVFSWIGLLRFPFGSVSSFLTLRALRPSASGSPARARGPLIATFWVLWQLEVVLFLVFLTGAPSFGTASRARAKRTMGDIRSIATAVESYATDFDTYPKAASPEELARIVSPDYIRQLPLKDGWENPLVYRVTPDLKSYAIASPGKDGKFEETDLWKYTEAFTDKVEADIVFRDGKFVRCYDPGHPGHP